MSSELDIADRTVSQAYDVLALAKGEVRRADAIADLILAIFDDFYRELCAYPYRAQRAFEAMDPQASVRISRERLGLYSAYITEHGPRIKLAFPQLVDAGRIWNLIDQRYLSAIVGRYEADIAVSFAHSIRRNISHGMWKPVDYSFSNSTLQLNDANEAVFQRLELRNGIDAKLIAWALGLPAFEAPFRDQDGDARRIAERVNALISAGALGGTAPTALDIVKAGFFRDLNAFVVGRWVLADGSFVPFIVALLNSTSGIYADALLHRTADAHNLFSSALANFHVTNGRYKEVCVFLHSLMPRRPLGLQYSTIGFNHVGKVSILDEVEAQMRQSGQQFNFSPGFAGSVAIGFTFDACTYHLKIIRDKPTASYKWGTFAGVTAVLDKYRVVHEINRAGSMLDNVMYFNLGLRRSMFNPAFLDHLCTNAKGNVQLDGDRVLIRSLIVQLKIVPLPEYLTSATESQMQGVIVNLGHCIRNNAATNIFNRDLDSRNYGVGRYGGVYLFDYDAVEKLTDVKIRTNVDREAGEEGVPDWFYEEGIVFLPEELEAGLQIQNDVARRYFRRTNADLMDSEYWIEIQRKLERGEVVGLKAYPDHLKLDVGNSDTG